MASLGDKLVHLSLEIEDRKKSAELLRQLISDQSSRHESEYANFEKDQAAILEKLATESKESQIELSRATGSLAQRKSALESQLDELLAKKKDADDAKKKNLDAARREIAEAKEQAHLVHKQEQAAREKAWYDGRVAEIHKLTWKGIQPNVERLTRKHKEQCDEIRSRTEFAKQKLELSCENDLSERIQTFQRSEQQSNACITQRNDFANMLYREQNEHAVSLMTLKDQLKQQEEARKKMYTLQLETMAKENDVALSKIRSSKSVQQLTHQLTAEKDARQSELEAGLERVGSGMSLSEAEWEESWREASQARVEKKNKKTMEELMKWRKREIDALIRQSLLDQSDYPSPEDAGARLAASHEQKISALKESLDKQQAANDETKRNISRIASRKAKMSHSIGDVKEELSAIGGKLGDVTNNLDRKRRQQKARVAEASKGIEEKVKSIEARRDDIEEEIANVQERIEEDLSKHRAKKDEVMREHEKKLDELQSYAAAQSAESDGKLVRVQSATKEQQAYLSRSQKLLTTRYNVKEERA